MKQLGIPYIRQISINACGAAALEMVYLYSGLKDISQSGIFEKYKKYEPHGSGNFYITTSDLIVDAQSRGFDAYWDRVNPEETTESINAIKELFEEGKLIIVCQQYSKELPLIGHFRVITGVDDEYVYFHDPSEIGGPKQQWSHEKFMDYWKATGQNVTGGVYIALKLKA